MVNRMFESGPDSGCPLWSMVATAPGPTLVPTKGERTPGAKPAVIYERLLSR